MDERTTKCFNCDGSKYCYGTRCETYAVHKKAVMMGLNPTCTYYHVINNDIDKLIRIKEGRPEITDLLCGVPCVTFDISELLGGEK